MAYDFSHVNLHQDDPSDLRLPADFYHRLLLIKCGHESMYNTAMERRQNWPVEMPPTSLGAV